VHNGAGSRTSAEQKFNQVTEASPMPPWDVQDWSLSSDTAKYIQYILQSSKRKGGDIDKAIFIPESTINVIMDRGQSAFVSTRSLAELEDALICDGGATSTLTRLLENRTEESGVFAVINKKINKSKSFPFMSEHSKLLSLKSEQMNATQFDKQSEYELWHQRLGHSSNPKYSTLNSRLNQIEYRTGRLEKADL
jgi:hypothetical protein